MRKILVLLIVPLQLIGQSLPDSIIRKVDSLFNRYTTTTPGCAVAIIKNGELVFKKGYGMANLEQFVPATPSTIYRLASVSKPLTDGSCNLPSQTHVIRG